MSVNDDRSAETPVAAAPQGGSRKMADLVPRVLSSLGLGAVAGGALWIGGFATVVLVALAGAAMGWEYRTIMAGPDGRFGLRDALTPVALAVAPALAHVFGAPAALGAIAIAAVLTAALDWGRRGSAFGPAGLAFIGVALVSFVFLRDQPRFGFEAALWLVLVVVGTDVGGYFAGRMIGGPRLAPTLSPGKTWSGLGGGLVLAAGLGALFSWGTTGTYAEEVCAVSILAAFVAVAGDLAESGLKRRFGVKDASKLIPGHGGVLDRLDGLMAAAIVAAIVTFARGKEVFVW